MYVRLVSFLSHNHWEVIDLLKTSQKSVTGKALHIKRSSILSGARYVKPLKSAASAMVNCHPKMLGSLHLGILFTWA